MWRPVALSAFLALLFISTRLGYMPLDHSERDAAEKSDLLTLDHGENTLAISASTPEHSTPIIIGSDQWSEHPKTSTRSQAAHDQSGRGEQQTVASAVHVPPPEPKIRHDDAETQIIISATEERTALETVDASLSLMPPGPDFPARVQTELARLGCYTGRVDNIWGPMSRQAVRVFSDKSALGLEQHEPTRALLARLRQAPDGFCTSECATPGSANCTVTASVKPEDRPDYLPPWMRGQAMPSTQTESESPPVSVASAAPATLTDAQPETQPSAAVSSRPEPSALDARDAARQQRSPQREARRRTPAFKPQNFDFAWPGQ
jgi:hypothetical protein